MRIIYAQEDYTLVEGEETIFLAGPTPRDEETPSWRSDFIDNLEFLGFDETIFVPEMRNGWTDDFEYGDQIAWEQHALEIASIVVFWVPREMSKMPALTTNFEFGQALSTRPETIVLGYPKYAERMRYLDYMARANKVKVRNTMLETAKICIKNLNRQ